MNMSCRASLPLLLALVALVSAAGCGGEAPVAAAETQSLPQRSTASLDDHGDTPDTATPVTPGLRFAGDLTDSWDRDVFSFTAAPGHFYRFGCTFQDATSGWRHEWVQEQGLILAREDVYGPGAPGLHFKPGAGTAFLRLETDSLELSGAYTCLLDDLGPDDHGDTRAEATPMSPGVSATGTLEVRDDVDAFTVELTRGHFHRASCGGGTLAVCQGAVVSPSGAVTDFVQGGATFNATHDGTYVVLVRTQPGPDPEIRGTYSVRVDLVGDDDHADTREHATRLQPSPLPFTGVLSGSIDLDVFTFTATAGRVYRFTCDVPPGQTRAPMLWLLNGAGGWVGGSSPALGKPSIVSVEAPAAGDYFLELFHDTYSGSYTCTFEDLGPDDHGDTPAQATEVSLPLVLEGRMETQADVDAFTFRLRPGHIYRFWKEGAVAMRLRDASGGNITNGEYLFAYEAPSEGMYTLEVLSIFFSWAPTYVLHVEDMGPDDHGNTRETATLLEPGAVLTGWRHAYNDTDVFVFQATENALYRLTCTGCAPRFDSPSGRVGRIQSGVEPAVFTFDVAVSEPIYVFIEQGSYLNFYNVRLEYLGKDDHGDDVANATPLTWPIRLSASLETVFDTDAFSVNLLAGQTRIVRAGGNFSTRVTVLGPDGAEVARNFSGEFTPTLPGVHHILVQPEVSPWSFPSGPYQLLLE